MRHEIPIQTILGKPTPYSLVVEGLGDDVRLTLDAGFAGRDVDEELPCSALAELVSGGARRNDDLLGLSFETDGGELVKGTVGVGSGNERFTVRRDDLAAALNALE